MKTLHLSILAISLLILTIPASFFSVHAYSSMAMDGTVSLKGCSIIGGNITQATDVQNMTISVCNYHGKHFKIIEYDICIDIGFGKVTDPQTGNGYNFPLVCDIPATCDPKYSWINYALGHEEKVPVVINGIQSNAIVEYGRGMCGSESYNEQENKLSIIATQLWTNQTNVNVLIPKYILGNTPTATVGGKEASPTVTDYPSTNAIPACTSCYRMEIPVNYSPLPIRIEIGGEQVPTVPEFPTGQLVLAASVASFIVLYRIGIRK